MGKEIWCAPKGHMYDMQKYHPVKLANSMMSEKLERQRERERQETGWGGGGGEREEEEKEGGKSSNKICMTYI